MLEVDISRRGHSQQSIPQGLEASEQTSEPPKQVGGGPVIMTPVKPHHSQFIVICAFFSVFHAEHQGRMV